MLAVRPCKKQQKTVTFVLEITKQLFWIMATMAGNCKSVLPPSTSLNRDSFCLTLLSYLSALLTFLVMGGNIAAKNAGLTDRCAGSVVLSQLRSLDLCFQKNHLLNGVVQLLVFIGFFFR